MIKRIAVCAVLLLLIIPAFAMAAGQGAGESGKGASAGKSQQAQQVPSGTCNKNQLRSCQGSGGSGNTASGQMLQIKSREHVRDMLQNMIENQTRLGQGTQHAGAGQKNGSASMQATGAAAGLLQQEDGSMIRGQMLGQKRTQFGDAFGNSTSADQIRDRIRDMAKNQTRIQNGSCISGLTL